MATERMTKLREIYDSLTHNYKKQALLRFVVPEEAPAVMAEEIFPLVYVLTKNKIAINLDITRDTYMFVDINPKASRLIDTDKLPEGWVLTTNNIANMEIDLGIKEGPLFLTKEVERIRLASKKHRMTENEALEILSAFRPRGILSYIGF